MYNGRKAILHGFAVTVRIRSDSVQTVVLKGMDSEARGSGFCH